MGKQHNVQLLNTRPGRALMEIAEDRLAEVGEHYQDAAVQGKASVITIKLTVTPDERRERMNIAVNSSVTLAPRKGFQGDVFVGLNADGEVQIAEFNPQQLRMFAPAEAVEEE